VLTTDRTPVDREKEKDDAEDSCSHDLGSDNERDGVWPRSCGAEKNRGAVVLFECRGISSTACCTGKKLHNSRKEILYDDASDRLDLPEQRLTQL
jgi:hypothetical protein